MTRASVKDFLREIKSSLGRFISIFAIVMIGTAFFSGIIASPENMKYSADYYFDKYNMVDIRVLATLGLTDDDMNAIRQLKSVDKVQPGYFIDGVTMVNSVELVLRVHSLPKVQSDESLNQLRLVEGRLPENSGECVVEKPLTVDYGISVGDTIDLSSGNDTPITEEALDINKFKVVGMVESAYYLTYEKGSSDIGSGKVTLFMYIPEDDFKYEVYTEALVTISGARELNCYSSKYKDVIDRASAEIENLGEDRSSIRLEEVKAKAYAELDKAKAEYEKAKTDYDTKIANAEQQLEEALVDISKGEAQLDTEKKNYRENTKQAEANLANAKKNLDEGEAEYAKAEKDYNDAMAEYGDDLKEINDNIERVNNLLATANKNIADIEEKLKDPNLSDQERSSYEQLLSMYKEQVDSLNQELDSLNKANDQLQALPGKYKAQLDSSRKRLDEAQKEYDDAEKALADSKKQSKTQFTSAEKQLNDANKKYAAAQLEYETQKASGAEELDRTYVQLIKAEDKIESISSPKWYVLDRNTNYGYTNYKSTADSINSIANVFPIFFFLVAALVCLTTMTRMVDEHRGIIGAYKALGYSSRTIASKYVIYAALASILGGAVGVCTGDRIFPQVIFKSYSLMYTLPEMLHISQWLLMAVSVIMGVAVTTLAAGTACYREFRETPAALLRPKAPKPGKKILLERIQFIWRSLTFSQKVTARNIFRYKKRFLMTVIGIAGCAALLVAGFGLNDSISQVVSKQYKDIFNYNLGVKYSLDADDESREKAISVMKEDEHFGSLLQCTEYNATITAGGKSIAASMMVPEDTDSFSSYITLRERATGRAIELKDSGIVITELMAKELKVGIGDSIELNNGEGSVKKIAVSGITENYVFHYAYMSSAAYKEMFRISKDSNMLLVKLFNTSSKTEEAIGRQLIKSGAVSSVFYYTSAAESFKDSIKSLNSIVYVIILCAGILAFVVLYNLTNINIEERIREIATIKVLGFYKKEVAMYVYRENILLSLIGTAGGLVLGIFLHRYIMISIEQDTVMFGYYINPLSFLYAFSITIVFTMLVNIVMYRRITNIPMVESLKSVE